MKWWIHRQQGFFLYKKWFKSWKKAEKKGKIKRKKLQKFFCLGASTWREEMPLIKVSYFMLNFLNLKSFLSHLFLGQHLASARCARDYFDKFFLTLTYFYYEILILIMLQCINEKPCFHHNWILAPLAPLKSSMCTVS